MDGDEGLVPQWVQCMRLGWFPATTTRPSTVFAFEVLDEFHELNLQAKTNANDFYKSQERLTDNSGALEGLVSCAPVVFHADSDFRSCKGRYKQFSHCARLWRHLKALVRAGRGHDPEGVAATKQGALVVECPACPHPDKNLPEGWENAPEDVRYVLNVCVAVSGMH